MMKFRLIAFAAALIFAPCANSAVLPVYTPHRPSGPDQEWYKVLRGQQEEIQTLKNALRKISERSIRLTTKCDGQICFLKEAVTFGNYEECMNSLAPAAGESSTCSRANGAH
jgi:hypothetical protein